MGVGIYIFIFIDFNGGCQEIDEVVVNIDFLEVNINVLVFVFCVGGEVLLDGSVFFFGGFIIYQWFMLNGFLFFVFNQFIVLVGLLGIYILIIIYNDGQVVCIEQESVIL